MLNGKTVLITGGTGSFGQNTVSIILKKYNIKKLIVFSRDEKKQYDMAQKYPSEKYECMRYFIGDIRDKNRLRRAFNGVDYIIHAAALKHVPTAEYNPFEAIATNILGAQNIIDVAIDQGVKRVISLSTDKAANPINLYGATKLCSDKLFIAGNSYVGKDETRFSVVRYGNVLGSRGSVIPFFIKKRESGVLPITNVEMTRFWITLNHGVNFVLESLERMVGGEIFVPKIPSMKVIDLAKAICPKCEIKIIGMRPGEKIHEVLVPKDEARNTSESEDHYVIKPQFNFFERRFDCTNYKSVNSDFEYSSGNNSYEITIDEMKAMINGLNL